MLDSNNLHIFNGYFKGKAVLAYRDVWTNSRDNLYRAYERVPSESICASYLNHFRHIRI